MKSLILVVGAALLTAVAAWGQATAQIHGTVQDSSGAAVPGATVKATQTDTGVFRTATTEADGSYVLSNLPLGPYNIEVQKEGFSAALQSGIVLQVGSDPAVAVSLKPGTVSETVNVEANAALVETRTMAVGAVMENARILDLPLNGRNVLDLMTLSGAANTGSAGALYTSSANPFNSESISVAGGTAVGVNFVLDGAPHGNPANNLEMPTPFPDALEEYKIETSALQAQSGMHSAGAVNMVTKAGTNQIHGDLFEFIRNYDVNAVNAYTHKPDSLKRNQFGGTLGGPIKKNKLFFFGGFQTTFLRQQTATSTVVPTAAMLQGNFQAFASAACNGGTNITLKAPFVNNQLSQLDPVALALAQKLTPAQNQQCGQTIYTTQVSEDEGQYIGKLDYQISDKQSLFARYIASTIQEPEPYNLSKVLLASGTGIDALAQTLTIGDTYLFSPTLVNSFRVVANRNNNTRSEAGCCSLPSLGASMYDYGQNSSIISVTGGFTLGGNTASNGKTYVDVLGLNDDVNWVRGAHQFAFGVSAQYAQMNYYSNSYDRGQLTFSGQITGLGLADFLSGNLSTYVQAPPNGQQGSETYFGLYAQDTWKIAPRLTLNVGIRWEPYLPLHRRDGEVAYFDFANFLNGTRTSQFTNAPPGLVFPGDPGFPGNTGVYSTWTNFAPRAGLAWDPLGDGRTSVRASFGMFYDFQAMQYWNNTSLIPPWTPKITLTDVPFDNPWATYAGGNPFPLLVNKNTPFPLTTEYPNIPYNMKNPSVRSWNLSVQRQIGTQWVVSGSYLGTTSIHIASSSNLNPAVYIPGSSTTANDQARRIFTLLNPTWGPYFQKVINLDDGGTASYQALLLSVERRFNKYLTFNTNYTWSHCISDPYDDNLEGSGGVVEYLDPNDRRADRGDCLNSAVDIRQAFNLTAVARTPSFENHILTLIASNWGLSPIVRITTGIPYTVTTTADVGLTGAANQRVNQILPDVYGNGSFGDWLNPKAFQTPASGTQGNMGTANVRGPMFGQFDTALTRDFQIRERQYLQVRAEAFNVLNLVIKGPPIVTFNAGNFGQIVSTQPPRVMQFALKYVF